MLTRAMAKQLSVALAHECLFVDFLSEEEPKKVSEVLKHPGWVDAIQDELNQFARNKVWRLVPAPYGETIIGSRWVFRNKRDETGIVIKNKARLIPKRKSTLGACQLLGGKLVYWSAKKQQSIAMSSAEAEYVVVVGCCANILWMKSQLTNYDIIYEKVPIFCDNTSAIATQTIQSCTQEQSTLISNITSLGIIFLKGTLNYISFLLNINLLISSPSLWMSQLLRLIVELGMLNIDSKPEASALTEEN
ncbi:hypothetical protein Tco_0926741 [Tanacetum coccineum]|uniref:Reverse transcriptase Ty1/copia-type domain-containing protein n=1 Tax=Tanacetum coccineum TaxID=301880 RepID=A0ABQ5DBU5_9ASTR